MTSKNKKQTAQGLQRGDAVVHEFWEKVHPEERPFEATTRRPGDWDSNARCPKCPLRLPQSTSTLMEYFDRHMVPSAGWNRTRPIIEH